MGGGAMKGPCCEFPNIDGLGWSEGERGEVQENLC